MPRRGWRKVTREELVRALAWLAKERGERVTQREFANHLSCSHDVFRKHFRSWRELRRAAGLKSARAPAPRHFTDMDLVADYIRVRDLCRRTPTESDFSRFGSCRLATLQKRFGGDEGIRRWVQTFEGTEELAGKRIANQAPPNAREILHGAWESLRLGLALHSSDLRDRAPSEIDVVLCLRHDWPGCPWVVLELRQLDLESRG